MTTIPVARRRVPEMLDRGYALIDLPADPEAPAVMAGPDPDRTGGWVPLGDAVTVEAAHA